MSTQPLDYSAILADLEAKKAAIEATIGSVRAALALGALAGIGQIGDVATASGASSPMSLHNGEIPNGAFLGKSIPEAAKLYLEILKQKQSTRQISEALVRGGMETTSKNFTSIVHAVINRARKAPNSDFVRIGSNWGLSSWYKGLPVTGTPSKGRTKKKAKKAKPKQQSKSEAEVTPVVSPPAPSWTPPPAQPGIEQRVIEHMKGSPNAEFSVENLEQALGIKRQTLNMMLGRFVTKNKIEKTPLGYKLVHAA